MKMEAFFLLSLSLVTSQTNCGMAKFRERSNKAQTSQGEFSANMTVPLPISTQLLMLKVDYLRKVILDAKKDNDVIGCKNAILGLSELGLPLNVRLLDGCSLDFLEKLKNEFSSSVAGDIVSRILDNVKIAPNSLIPVPSETGNDERKVSAVSGGGSSTSVSSNPISIPLSASIATVTTTNAAAVNLSSSSSSKVSQSSSSGSSSSSSSSSSTSSSSSSIGTLSHSSSSNISSIENKQTLEAPDAAPESKLELEEPDVAPVSKKETIIKECRSKEYAALVICSPKLESITKFFDRLKERGFEKHVFCLQCIDNKRVESLYLKEFQESSNFSLDELLECLKSIPDFKFLVRKYKKEDKQLVIFANDDKEIQAMPTVPKIEIDYEGTLINSEELT